MDQMDEFSENTGFSEHVEDETYRLTPKGIEMIINMYEDYKSGMSVEEIEELYDLESGPEGTEEHHIEFRIIMAMGEISGIIDGYEELVEMSNTLDKVETDYLYGDGNNL